MGEGSLRGSRDSKRVGEGASRTAEIPGRGQRVEVGVSWDLSEDIEELNFGNER